MVFQKSEPFLEMVIVLFFSLTLIFLILLTISRLKKISTLKKHHIYNSLAGNFILAIIFENKSFVSLAAQKEYAFVMHDHFFRLRLLDTLIKLHKNYTGEYAKKLETFYYNSFLIEETYKKLKYGKWSVKCEAIRELAEMNVTSSYSLITPYVNAQNLTLRQEAIIAIIKLIGLKGLSFLTDYKELLTDWIQLNLISIIKNHFPTTDEPYYNSFINSQNKSVVLFGKRLKSFYEKTEDSFIEKTNLAQIDHPLNKNGNPISVFFINIKNIVQQKLTASFSPALNRIYLLSGVLFTCFLIVHLLEIFSVKNIAIAPIIGYAILNDVYVTFIVAIAMIPIVLISEMIGKITKDCVSFVIYFLIILIHSLLSVYFSKAKVPLGSDLLAYSMKEIFMTTKAGGGFSYELVGLIVLLLSVFIFLIRILTSKSVFFFKKRRHLIGASIILFSVSFLLEKERINSIGEYENYLAFNKSYFFAESIFKKYDEHEAGFPDDKTYYFSSSSDTTEKPIDADYPFYKRNSARNTLRPFFKERTTANKPNLVFIILEGMGSDFIGTHAKLGNFTPFLDSLSKAGLFWENTLSGGARTFAALPSIFGSLPFLTQGYLEAGENAPNANSLFRILNCNGYTSQYFTGSNASFDKMDIFLKKQGVEITLEQSNFGPAYKKLPGLNGFSWGYGDEDIYRKYFTLPKKPQPHLSVFFTVANHSPYLIPDQDLYKAKAKKWIETVSVSIAKKTFLRSYLDELSCIMYADDALKYFFNTYSQSPEFHNTIFIITGDHRAPEIPIAFSLDRFRVPLIIYSPLLKRTANFKSIVTHFDITPTLLALLSDVIRIPETNSWIGTLLDTSQNIIFDRQVAFMRNKNEFQDFMSGNYFLSGDDLYMLTNDLGLTFIENKLKKQQLKEQFAIFKSKNKQVDLTKKLIPDSALSCDSSRSQTDRFNNISN